MWQRIKKLKEVFLGTRLPENYLPTTVPSSRIYTVTQNYGTAPHRWEIRQFTNSSELFTSDNLLVRVETKNSTVFRLHVLTSLERLAKGLSQSDKNLLQYLLQKTKQKNPKERLLQKKQARKNRKRWQGELIRKLKAGGVAEGDISLIGKIGPLTQQAASQQGSIWLFFEKNDLTPSQITAITHKSGLQNIAPIAYFPLLPSDQFIDDLLRM